MIFTPEERRALLSLAVLLVAGQILAAWEEYRAARPDRELTAWFDRLAWVAADTTTVAPYPRGVTEILAETTAVAATAAPPARSAEGGRPTPAPPPTPVARVEPLDAAPPGILSGTRLRIAEATVQDLETLPGIGPSLAQKIAAERARGPFRAPEDLLRVPGIGPKKLAQLAAHLDFGREATQSARKDSCDSRDARLPLASDSSTSGRRR